MGKTETALGFDKKVQALEEFRRKAEKDIDDLKTQLTIRVTEALHEGFRMGVRIGIQASEQVLIREEEAAIEAEEAAREEAEAAREEAEKPRTVATGPVAPQQLTNATRKAWEQYNQAWNFAYERKLKPVPTSDRDYYNVYTSYLRDSGKICSYQAWQRYVGKARAYYERQETVDAERPEQDRPVD